MIYSARPKLGASSKRKTPLRTPHTLRLDGGDCPEPILDEPGTESFAEFAQIACADADQYDVDLASQVLARIQARVPGRIRRLSVFTTENAVILAGECSTFYTKQIAQHAAMGVLEYEQLINNINVRPAK